MPLPAPQYPLDDTCSTLFNNTLYTYNSQAFQSLQIQQDAQWSELPMGVAVQGGVCVKSTPTNNTDDAALYIVGGTSNSSDYQGLQRYTFADGAWETLTPGAAVTQNRLYHGAVYLNSSDSILLYAGTQDGSRQPSSQTFTIQASPPYLVTAYQSIAPPAIDPLLIQWTESKAIYIGGSETNTKAMIFSPSLTWVDSNATLAQPFYNTSNIKAIVINGDDASMTLYTFDMTTSPNSVNRTILIDGDGNAVENAVPIVSTRDVELEDWKEKTAMPVKRDDLTVADWPAYNGTLAPSSTRTSYSVCRDQSGLVVISGGNEEDVLCMFKARDNCWVNATSTLVSSSKNLSAQGGLGQDPSSTASTTAATASSTSTSSSATSAPAFPVKVLGAVLGSILGVALILMGILLLFRWRRKRRQHIDAGHQRRSSGLPDEKEGLDFADRGLPQMSSARQFRSHEPQESAGSFSSMAILMGRVGGHRRGGDKGNGSQGSDSSSQFNKKYKTAISKPIPQEQPMHFDTPALEKENPFVDERAVGPSAPASRPRGNSRGGRRGSTRRSSGWNRYWSGGSAMNILGFGSKRTTYGSDRSSESNYSDYRGPSQVTQNSAIVPPLKIGDRPGLNRVASGSPTVANAAKFTMPREMSGTIGSHGSVSTLSSYNDDRHDAFSSGVPASVHEQQAANPVDRQDWAIGRAYSNAYTESQYEQTLPRGTNQAFPPNTPFPVPPSQPPPPKPNSDMSWLNLGAGDHDRI